MKEKGNNNIIFLNLIAQNAQMGLLGIDTVISKIESEKIAKLVSEQRKEYEQLFQEAEEILIKFGAKVEEIGPLKEASSRFMSEAMTLKADDKKIVKLMMEGNQKGVIAILEKLNSFKDADAEVIDLAQKLLATEEHNMEEFKQYL